MKTISVPRSPNRCPKCNMAITEEESSGQGHSCAKSRAGCLTWLLGLIGSALLSACILHPEEKAKPGRSIKVDCREYKDPPLPGADTLITCDPAW